MIFSSTIYKISREYNRANHIISYELFQTDGDFQQMVYKNNTFHAHHRVAIC